MFFQTFRSFTRGRSHQTNQKKTIEKTYIKKKGQAVVDKNFLVVDQTLNNLFEVKIPNAVTAEKERSKLLTKMHQILGKKYQFIKNDDWQR